MADSLRKRRALVKQIDDALIKGINAIADFIQLITHGLIGDRP
jgi:hypothetical protein